MSRTLKGNYYKVGCFKHLHKNCWVSFFTISIQFPISGEIRKWGGGGERPTEYNRAFNHALHVSNLNEL